MDIEVIVTTWGSDLWKKRGKDTAKIHSAWHYHEDDFVSAGAARNNAVRDVDPVDWIIFLDADDELDYGYLEAMEAAATRTSLLLTPALKLGDGEAVCLTDRDIVKDHNPCPIGTMIHRIAFEEAGRFWDEPAWEDFAMFQRAVLVGAEIRFVPEAVYVASYNPRGRNSTVRNPAKLRAQIQRDNQQWLASK